MCALTGGGRGGKLFPAPERWQGNELLLPVIVPLPSRTLTPFQTIGGAATTIQWRVCDVETFASWTGGGKKRNGSGAFFFPALSEIRHDSSSSSNAAEWAPHPPHRRDSPASKPPLSLFIPIVRRSQESVNTQADNKL